MSEETKSSTLKMGAEVGGKVVTEAKVEAKVQVTPGPQINFYGCRNAYGEFSNFYPASIKIDGVTWPTTEHYFQAQKFSGQAGGPEYMEKIRQDQSAVNAKKYGGARSGTGVPKLRSDWEKVKDDVMIKAIYAKFTQHPNLTTLLLRTGSSPLAEHTVNDRYWGDGGDGSGKNRLGKLLMELRHQLMKIA